MDKSPQLMVGIPDRGLMVTYHAFIAQRLSTDRCYFLAILAHIYIHM